MTFTSRKVICRRLANAGFGFRVERQGANRIPEIAESSVTGSLVAHGWSVTIGDGTTTRSMIATFDVTYLTLLATHAGRKFEMM
jgi:hypothetical protein